MELLQGEHHHRCHCPQEHHIFFEDSATDKALSWGRCEAELLGQSRLVEPWETVAGMCAALGVPLEILFWAASLLSQGGNSNMKPEQVGLEVIF